MRLHAANGLSGLYPARDLSPFVTAPGGHHLALISLAAIKKYPLGVVVTEC